MSTILLLSALLGSLFGPAGTAPGVEVQHQARVRGEVVVRVVPMSSAEAPRPVRSVPPAEEEVSAPRRRPGAEGDGERQCVALSQIAGVRLGRERNLLLHLRDRSIITAAFDKSCPVQGFYSGFYVNRTDDGLLCEGRDTLHARTGVSCELTSFVDTGATTAGKESAKP